MALSHLPQPAGKRGNGDPVKRHIDVLRRRPRVGFDGSNHKVSKVGNGSIEPCLMGRTRLPLRSLPGGRTKAACSRSGEDHASRHAQAFRHAARAQPSSRWAKRPQAPTTAASWRGGLALENEGHLHVDLVLGDLPILEFDPLSLIQAAVTPRRVFVARSRPWRMASSKLEVEVEEISVTRATAIDLLPQINGPSRLGRVFDKLGWRTEVPWVPGWSPPRTRCQHRTIKPGTLT